jgi:polysaccharide export outer membrane protein
MRFSTRRTWNVISLGVFLLAVSFGLLTTTAAAQESPSGSPPAHAGYRIGVKDVVGVSVWGHPELSGKFTIGDDGILSFPLVGQLAVAGRVASEVETELTKRLADGFLKTPRVSVEIQQYLSQRIFVIGEVRSPGPIPLTGTMTLLEALARAGSMSEQAGGEVVVLRPAADQAAGAGPLAPGQSGATEVGRTSVQELRSGKLVANLALRDGDTIFIPRSEPFFMLGQVRSPGAYMAQSGLTILRAISMAGGTTSLGSTGKIRVVRIVDGVKKEFKAKLDDSVKAGDTIFVGTRLF